MKTVWKYSIELRDVIVLELPKGAEVLSVQEQFDHPEMWVMVDTLADKEKRYFECYGTGHEMRILTPGYTRKLINTFQMSGGNYVFHFFELIKQTPT
jgi:hypothetical protein